MCRSQWVNGFDIENFRNNFKLILEALLTDGKSDGIVVIVPDFLELFNHEWWDISTTVEEVTSKFPNKPIVFSVFGPKGLLAKNLNKTGKTVVFNSCERAVNALARLNQYYDYLNSVHP
jgi:acyl-CoA synthetase (NDP forming)